MSRLRFLYLQAGRAPGRLMQVDGLLDAGGSPPPPSPPPAPPSPRLVLPPNEATPTPGTGRPGAGDLRSHARAYFRRILRAVLEESSAPLAPVAGAQASALSAVQSVPVSSLPSSSLPPPPLAQLLPREVWSLVWDYAEYELAYGLSRVPDGSLRLFAVDLWTAHTYAMSASDGASASADALWGSAALRRPEHAVAWPPHHIFVCDRDRIVAYDVRGSSSGDGAAERPAVVDSALTPHWMASGFAMAIVSRWTRASDANAAHARVAGGGLATDEPVAAPTAVSTRQPVLCALNTSLERQYVLHRASAVASPTAAAATASGERAPLLRRFGPNTKKVTNPLSLLHTAPGTFGAQLHTTLVMDVRADRLYMVGAVPHGYERARRNARRAAASGFVKGETNTAQHWDDRQWTGCMRLDTCPKWNAAAPVWMPFAEPVEPLGRTDFATVLWRRQLIVCGGFVGDAAVASCMALPLPAPDAADTAATVTTLKLTPPALPEWRPFAALKHARYSHSMVTADNGAHLFVVGGICASANPPIERYAPDTGEWVVHPRIALPGDATPAPSASASGVGPFVGCTLSMGQWHEPPLQLIDLL